MRSLQSTWIQQTLPAQQPVYHGKADNEAIHNAFRNGWL